MSTRTASDDAANTEVGLAVDHHDEMRASPRWLAHDPSWALKVIAVLLVFCGLYFAASLLAPIAAAILLSMMLASPVALLERLHVSRPLAAAVVVLTVMGLLVAGLFALAGPAKSWIERAP